MAKRRVTINEVAEAAGVSKQTVSRVLNDRPDVADATRAHVKAVIDRLDYRPSALARSLSSQRSYTLGVVTAGLQHIGPSRTLSGIAQEAEHRGYALLLQELPRFEGEDAQRALDTLLGRQVDGILWAAPEVGENRRWTESLVPGLRVPILFLHMAPRPSLFVAAIDNRAGARLAVRYLLEHRCRCIGHIAGPLAFWEAAERKAGWEDALDAAGVPPQERFWVEGDWSAEGSEGAICGFLDAHPEIDAVFAANDQMALCALLCLQRRAIRVPEDVSVVGFDGIPDGAYYWPPLTTVHQDQQQLGRIAVRELALLIDAQVAGKGTEPGHILLPPRLIVRESTRRQ
jgi:DNA-binding LacI/PurR family transcriptional regulator